MPPCRLWRRGESIRHLLYFRDLERTSSAQRIGNARSMSSFASSPHEQKAGSATAEGTLRYAAKFQGQSAAGNYREIRGGIVLSSLGIGTYLAEPDAATDKAYTAAIVAAVESGINVIDTAINYRLQRSERSVGAALAQLYAKGFSRDEL